MDEEKIELRVRSLNSWCQYVYDWCERKGWNENLALGNMVLNCVTELAEAWEEIRNGHEPKDIYTAWDNDGNGKPEGFGVELADLLIRVFHICARYGIDIEALIAVKMAYNEKRPYRHGGKTA